MAETKNTPPELKEQIEAFKVMEEANVSLTSDNAEMTDRIAHIEAKLSAEKGRTAQLQREVRSLKKTLAHKASTHGSIDALRGTG